MTPLQTKEQLFHHCQQAIAQRKGVVEKSIASIEQALKEESKGTSGDKHHTARAMLQIDREQAGRQLHEIELLANSLNRVPWKETSTQVRSGSLIHTSQGMYFICISLGQVTIEGTTFGVLGPQAPLGQLLMGKAVGDEVSFRKQQIRLLALH